MGSQKWIDQGFGKLVKAERDQRGWTQLAMAQMLEAKGIPMHATTIAKIEAGDRSVRINEAAGIADLFELPLDFLLGRKPGTRRNELSYSLRHLRDTARQSGQALSATMETIQEQLDYMPKGFDHADMLRRVGDYTWRWQLFPASVALLKLADLADELLRREDGTPSLAKEALMELDVPKTPLEVLMTLDLPQDVLEVLEAVTGLTKPTNTISELKEKMMTKYGPQG